MIDKQRPETVIQKLDKCLKLKSPHIPWRAFIFVINQHTLP
jgi:hypothetical protein